ncbi:ferredoxin-dependent glutamate synthase, chloroplastic-like isoform X3 [Vigna umbellata]|uniref:ferredoxin-dependent glutamate synthase, chloroplastic-like isoform X2 n=1 Tax=Vigna umbellata TaxID=87088 RepID=UPI001F5FEE69|nr:ferredoxin-dependent glutamate synthase, chloroplastic-like isoform X2 [Vigna umbellata]XP_047177128.1 ferredoxin-dependent glutamate synthase, chloroplastic-like isoform X3 [Vigna umbellata]
MALHSVSSVPHVLRLSEPFPSLHNAHLLLDPVPFRRKPKRRTRKLRAFPAPSPLSHSSVKAVLHIDRTAADNSLQASPASSSSSQPQVANLEDILSERGACGVGFIANLENKGSHEIVKDALNALSCMEHRGGCGADNDSGDGSGLMTAVPWDLLDNWANKQGIASFDKSHTGVGMVFLPKDAQLLNEAKKVIVNIFRQEGLEVLGWRPVPVNTSVVGYYAKETMPNIQQVFVKIVKEENVDDIERELYICRKLIEKAVSSESWGNELYFCSLSNQTIVYKGMLRSEVLGLFYSDLQNDLYKSPFAIYHRRYSTNTSPRWPLAQPMRLLGHNGEINTIQGNLNWMQSREPSLKSPVWRDRENEIRPYGNPKASDSANLDSAAELLIRSGRSPEEAMMILVPEAYKNHPTLTIKYPEALDFYDYYKGQMEAWDGPALLLFSDGKTVGACLDRNGLRPARYWRTSDNMVYVASEVGVVPVDDSKVVLKGRLGPGMMITVDLPGGQVYENTEVKKRVALSNPYGKWIKENLRSLKPGNFLSASLMDNEAVLRNQQAFGYSSEDVQMVIESMASQGKEPTFCMGDDIPLAALSQKPHMLFDYFKQRFAQVTNPAIDPLREGLVMSLEVNIGKRGNLLEVGPENASQVMLSSPVLNEGELESLLKDSQLNPQVLPTFFDITKGIEGSLEKALNKLCEAADEAVRNGSQLLVLSDRSDALEPTHPAIPILLAVGTVHQHLILNGLRTSASIIADTAQCFSTHQFACLIGYGASAVSPYLALETCRQWRLSNKTVNLMRNGKMPTVSIEQAQKNYCKAVKAGLLKILSKMGISLLSSYCGAQIFEVYGLGKEVVDLAFRGSVSKIGGLTFDEVARETLSFWVKAFSEDTAKRLENFGFIQSRPGGEYHANNPEMSKLLHKAVRQKSQSAFSVYQQYLANRPANVLRDLLEFKSDRAAIPVGKVEPASSIVQRFCTGGMSLGAISRETHEAIAIAMNRLGGKSNSGEGGEDPVRWKPLTDVVDGYSPTLPHLKGLQNGDTATSAIKQVASGRFGVTPTFLANADQLEIKIAQGAKPGEGGQLPGKKVSMYIARLRNSKPGVPLISPPPHHDIYSIEDLAQLIFDLHQVNPRAKVSVKLVAEAGIGTVASGVAKGNADIIQISGHDGGTGASPISSIKHAGGPWELGLTESHQTLIENGLRERVILRVDGGFRSGVDVMMAAIMGADEYGFGSVAMIATGCVMARICHTNNCPVGVASQREELRARFPGVPGDLVNYFLYVAEEVRGILAQLGYEKLDDVIGRTDLLQPRDISLAKTQHLDLSYILSSAGLSKWSSTEIRNQEPHTNGPVLDDGLLADPEIADAIENEKVVNKTVNIYNIDRAVCGRIAGVIAKKYGDTGFAGQLNITFTGSAGQSFACFLTPGMNIRLVGEANDYVGKGIAGGELVITPVDKTGFEPEDAAIVGNTCLYGATGGQVFVRGRAGERFAVRNSLAEAVVEGTGDHCCEYMTGGCVVVLGKVGRNVAAGMTGGLAYILDEDDTLIPKVNREIVKIQRVSAPVGQMQLKSLIEAHVEKTGSTKGAAILKDWDKYLSLFWQLVPPSEEDTPEANAKYDTTTAEQVSFQSA